MKMYILGNIPVDVFEVNNLSDIIEAGFYYVGGGKSAIEVFECTSYGAEQVLASGAVHIKGNLYGVYTGKTEPFSLELGL